jgi:hypothetical protein
MDRCAHPRTPDLEPAKPCTPVRFRSPPPTSSPWSHTVHRALPRSAPPTAIPRPSRGRNSSARVCHCSLSFVGGRRLGRNGRAMVPTFGDTFSASDTGWVLESAHAARVRDRHVHRRYRHELRRRARLRYVRPSVATRAVVRSRRSTGRASGAVPFWPGREARLELTGCGCSGAPPTGTSKTGAGLPHRRLLTRGPVPRSLAGSVRLGWRDRTDLAPTGAAERGRVRRAALVLTSGSGEKPDSGARTSSAARRISVRRRCGPERGLRRRTRHP